jgi:multidrug efflux pump subunit AcrA (membrane-fusion protein)
MDADPVLQRFNNDPQQQDDEPGIGEKGDGDTWPQLRKNFDAAVPDKAKIEAKRLSQGLHSLQVNNELLCLQNAELRAELNLIKKRPINSTTLTTQEGDDWHGGAVFYSPRKLASVRARKAAELDEAAELQLQKTRDREAKAAEAAQKKQDQAAAKVARQQAKIERNCEQKQRAEEKAAERALKKQQQQAATTQKSHDTANKRKRKASHKAAKKLTKRRRVAAASSRVDAGPPEASPPPKFGLRNRQLKTPARYK